VENEKTETLQIVKKKKRRIPILSTFGEVVHELSGKMASRKLMVWTVFTVAFFMGMVSQENFVLISSGYIGTQALLDYFKK